MQVFDLGKHKPDEVIGTLWRNFENPEAPSEEARAIRARLRIVAAGGDGTVAWVLQVRAAQGSAAGNTSRSTWGTNAACRAVYRAPSHPTDQACEVQCELICVSIAPFLGCCRCAVS
jgi:hypothetical protein